MNIHKFKDFIIVEKVSGTEIKKALANKNIMIGLEFEFNIDDLNSNEEAIKQLETLDKHYEKYKVDIDKWLDKVMEVRVNAYNYFLNEKEKMITKLKRQSREITEQIKNTDDEEYISDLQQDKKVITERLYQLIAAIRVELPDMLDRFGTDLKYISEEEYIDANLMWVPIPHKDLYKWYANSFGIYLFNDWSGVINRTYTIDSYHDIIVDASNYAMVDKPSEFDDPYDLEVDGLEEYDWSDLPFNSSQALIGAYHGSADYTKWRIEKDASLNANGVEIISPVMTLQKGLKVIPEMFKFIDKHGGTDNLTGFHVNLSYKGKSLTRDADLMKLMMFMDEGFIWKKFPSRMKNAFTSSVIDYIRAEVAQHGNFKVDPALEVARDRTVDKLVSQYKSKLKGPARKMFGINVSHAGKEKAGRIEFRYIGGKNYHRKWGDVKLAIARFAFYLEVALDPKARQKEYVLKLNRLYDKHAPKQKVDKLAAKQKRLRR